MKRCTMEFRRKPFIVFYDIKSLRINSKSSTLVHQIISLSEDRFLTKWEISINIPWRNYEAVYQDYCVCSNFQFQLSLQNSEQNEV